MRKIHLQDLEELRSKMIEMGALVEKALDKSFEAILIKDEDLAKEVIYGDDTIDEMDREIERICLKVMTRQQPFAKDLRFVSSCLKMVTDLERIGDHAQDISELLMDMSRDEYPKIIFPMEKMMKEVKTMLTDVLNSFIEDNVEKAQAVIEHDEIVNDLYDEVLQMGIELLRDNNTDPQMVIDLVLIAKYLERIGDHSGNIGQWVRFNSLGYHPSKGE